MEHRQGILYETLRYFWQRLFHRRCDPFADRDELIVDVPKGSPQRRAFVRAACIFPVNLEREGGTDSLRSALPDAPMLDSGINGDETGAILNISGGGVLFVTRGRFAAGERITIAGRIFDRPMRFGVQNARPDDSLTHVTGLNGYGARFTAIAEEDRRHIIRHVFAGYRRLRELNA